MQLLKKIKGINFVLSLLPQESTEYFIPIHSHSLVFRILESHDVWSPIMYIRYNKQYRPAKHLSQSKLHLIEAVKCGNLTSQQHANPGWIKNESKFKLQIHPLFGMPAFTCHNYGNTSTGVKLFDPHLFQ